VFALANAGPVWVVTVDEPETQGTAMQTFFFYDPVDGSAAIGEIVAREFHTHYAYPAGAFARGWALISDIPLSGGRLLFYDAQKRSAVVGRLTASSFTGEKTYPADSFGSWTHVAAVRRDGHGTLLFYDSRTGAAAVGFDPTVARYGAGAFGTWTHIVPGLRSERVLFYNGATGAGAVGFDPSTQTFGEGVFGKGWTAIASAPASNGEDVLVFYNASDRSGALGRLGSGGFRTVATYGPGAFGAWTHLVGFDDGFLFVDKATGAAALAEIHDEQVVTVKTWPPDAFKRGWGYIGVSSSAMQFADLQAFAWPLSAKPGERIAFKASTAANTYTVTFVGFRNRPLAEVDADTIANSEELVEVSIGAPTSVSGEIQVSDATPDSGALAWNESFPFDVPDNQPSGLCAARLEDSRGAQCYAPFVVQPPDDRRADFAVIVNVTTWNAYNGWGGYSRYGVPGDGAWVFSYHRPVPHALNMSDKTGDYQYSSKHLARGELWFVNWMVEKGFKIDLHTDLDLHAGIADLSSYKALIFQTHPEYQTLAMRDAIEDYLGGGGSLVYLGGNGFYDCVDIAVDLSTLTVYGTSGTGRKHLFRQPPILRPESALLGVAFPWSSLGGDIGNNAGSRVAFQVLRGDHPFFAGTGMSNGDVFGTRGWCVTEDAGSLEGGGASGWECDARDASTPSSTVMLARGMNSGPAAEMVTYNHPGGGLVFSAGSMTIQGAIPVDAALQNIVSNVLAEAARRR
jgi:hypothetical protein